MENLSKLKSIREDKGKSVQDVVFDLYDKYNLKVTPQHIYNIEKSGKMSIRLGRILAMYYETTLDDLLT